MSPDRAVDAAAAHSWLVLLLYYTLAFAVGLLVAGYMFFVTMGQAFYLGPDGNIRSWLMLVLVLLSPLAGATAFQFGFSAMTGRRCRAIFWLVAPSLTYGVFGLVLFAMDSDILTAHEKLALAVLLLFGLGFALVIRGERARSGP